MTREEIKNKLYYVADTIKMNADKFARGEALENDDWLKAAREFTSCMNYLLQTHRDFDEVRKEEEKFEKPDAEPRKQVIGAVPLDHNGRKFSEDAIKQFSLEKHRPVTLGFPDPQDWQAMGIRTAGEIREVSKLQDGYTATVCIDENLVAGRKVMEAMKDGFAPVFTLCGEDKKDDKGADVFRYTHVAVSFPNSCPKALDD